MDVLVLTDGELRGRVLLLVGEVRDTRGCRVWRSGRLICCGWLSLLQSMARLRTEGRFLCLQDRHLLWALRFDCGKRGGVLCRVIVRGCRSHIRGG